MECADRILRKPEVRHITGLSDVHLSRLEKLKQFPGRIKLVPGSGQQGACGWLESEVMAWLDARAKDRAA